MTRTGKFILRLVIYGAVAAWLVADLYWLQGPLSRKLRSGSVRHTALGVPGEQVVARVYGYYIDRSQLDRAVAARLWLEGKKPGDLPVESRRLARYAALEELIDHELLRAKVKVHTLDLLVTDAEMDARLERFRARFRDAAEMEAALRAQGLGGVAGLRERLGAMIQQEKYIESRVGSLAVVTEEEARAWYEANKAAVAQPERVELRQVFLPTLERDADEVKAVLAAGLAALGDGSKEFAVLARELSEDPVSKEQGGQLGWVTRERLPAELAAPVFAMELNRPALVRSKMGWHLMEVTGRKAAEAQEFAQAKGAVMAALEAVKRRQAVDDFRNELRKLEARNVEIFRERVDAEGG